MSSGRRIIFYLWLGTLAGLWFTACGRPNPDQEKRQVIGILKDVLREYNRIDFAARAIKSSSSLTALQMALDLQREIARRHGMTYDQYLKAVRRLKYEPGVYELLEEVKNRLKICYKFKGLDLPEGADI